LHLLNRRTRSRFKVKTKEDGTRTEDYEYWWLYQIIPKHPHQAVFQGVEPRKTPECTLTVHWWYWHCWRCEKEEDRCLEMVPGDGARRKKNKGKEYATDASTAPPAEKRHKEPDVCPGTLKPKLRWINWALGEALDKLTKVVHDWDDVNGSLFDNKKVKFSLRTYAVAVNIPCCSSRTSRCSMRRGRSAILRGRQLGPQTCSGAMWHVRWAPELVLNT
jgi:hypothetical protein